MMLFHFQFQFVHYFHQETNGSGVRTQISPKSAKPRGDKGEDSNQASLPTGRPPKGKHWVSRYQALLC